MTMSGNEAWNRNCFRRRRKVDRDGAEITLSGRLFQMVGQATGKARPPTVDSLTDGILEDDWSEQSGGNVDQQWRRQKEEVGWVLASVRQRNAEGVRSEAPMGRGAAGAETSAEGARVEAP